MVLRTQIGWFQFILAQLLKKFIVCHGCISELLSPRRHVVLPELKLVDCSALGKEGHT